MKTITKQSLTELSKKMPVLSEKESSEIIGGYKFYDASGNYLGEMGASSEIRIADMDSGKFNSIRLTNTASSLIGLYSGSIGMEAATTSQKSSIIKSIAAQNGIRNVTANTRESNSTMGGWHPNNPEYININPSSEIFTSGKTSEYDILCTMIHENNHRNKPKTGANYNDPRYLAEMELEAYEEIFRSGHYQYTSERYKESCRRGYAAATAAL